PFRTSSSLDPHRHTGLRSRTGLDRPPQIRGRSADPVRASGDTDDQRNLVVRISSDRAWPSASAGPALRTLRCFALSDDLFAVAIAPVEFRAGLLLGSGTGGDRDPDARSARAMAQRELNRLLCRTG